MTANPDIAVVREGVMQSLRTTDAVHYTHDDFDAAMAALDRLEARLRETEAERDEALAAWNVVASDIETGRLEARVTELEAEKAWREHHSHLRERAEAAEKEVARLREALEAGIKVASQYLDTDRGDLDGWIELARALAAEETTT